MSGSPGLTIYPEGEPMHAATKSRKRNVYAGACGECGESVAPYAGTVQRVDGAWQVEHDRCPAAVEAERQAWLASQPPVVPWADRTLAERIEITTERNPYMTGKVALVERATSYDDAIARISASSQGMTMDYMTEWSNERSANDLAREYAVEKFEVVR